MLESANAEAILAENELRAGSSEVDAKYSEAHAITVQYQQLLDQRTNAIAALSKERCVSVQTLSLPSSLPCHSYPSPHPQLTTSRDEARAQLRAARLALIDGVEVDAAAMVGRDSLGLIATEI